MKIKLPELIKDLLMGYIVSRDCSISVTVSRKNMKNFTVKREEKILFIVSEHFLVFQITVKIPKYSPFRLILYNA